MIFINSKNKMQYLMYFLRKKSKLPYHFVLKLVQIQIQCKIK